MNEKTLDPHISEKRVKCQPVEGYGGGAVFE
jgi:hypothetical protein